jgi:ABC-type nitrate/sulfonate/bicarbonate transport system ATPase subunit
MFVTHSIPEAVRLGHQIAVMGTGPGHLKQVFRSPSPPTPDSQTERDDKALRELRTEISMMLGGAGI